MSDSDGMAWLDLCLDSQEIDERKVLTQRSSFNEEWNRSLKKLKAVLVEKESWQAKNAKLVQLFKSVGL